MLLLLVLATTLAFSNAYPGPEPPGKELLYQYSARMRVGTYEPVTYASQLILEGKLHLQPEDTLTTAKFSDLTLKLYNGELNFASEYSSHSLPLPEEASELESSFRIKYDNDGKALCIITNDGESEYSRNFKKAIASILQLDVNSIKFDSDHAFITEERNIYGKTLVDYNVVPVRENEVIVTKQNEVKTSKNWYKYFNINAEPLLTGHPLVSPLTLDSHRQYDVVKTAHGIEMKHIETKGDIYVHPIKGMAESNYVSVNQTFRLLESSLRSKEYPPPPPPPPGRCTDELGFTYDVETEKGSMQDMTFGRRHITDKQLIINVQKDLNEVVLYLKENHLTPEAPDVLRGQSINRLQRELSNFNGAIFDTLYTQLCEGTSEVDKLQLEIFHQILPLVGTRAAIVFIQELICNKRVTDDIAIELLRKMPFHLRMPSERLLKDVEELLNLPKPCNATVQNAAILSFATLVHKVYASKPLFEQNVNNWDVQHRSVRRERGRSTLDTYIKKFVEGLKGAEDYPTQYLYMQGLHNIKVGNVPTYLLPYVKGEVQNSNRHLRVLAMYASLAGQIENPEQTYKIYWPIFTDRRLHLEIRIAAYNVIMATKPTMSKLWNIYWYMQSDTNPELYHYFYTNIISLAISNNPETVDYKVYAEQILKFLRKPMKHYLTGSYVSDYIDPKYGHGAMLHYNIQSTNSSKVFYVDLINNVFNVPFRYYSMYIKIDGLNESDLAKPTAEKVSEFYELQQLIQTISTLHHKKRIAVEYSILKHGQVIQYGIYDRDNISELVEILKNIITKGEKWLETYLEIEYIMMKDTVLPNDLGFLSYIQVKTPNLIRSQASVATDFDNNIIDMNGDFRLHHSMRSTYDTGVYNPLTDTWHGFHRIHAYDLVLPINFNLQHNVKQLTLKLTLNCPKDVSNLLGLRSHTTLQTYIAEDLHSYLNKSNSQCGAYSNVSAGTKYRKTSYLLDADDENTGFHYQVAVFDSEQQLYHKSLLELLEDSLYNKRDYYADRHTAQLLTIAQNLWLHTVLSPAIGISGFLARAYPSTHQKVTKIEFSFRLNQASSRGEGVHLPGTTINTRATYTVNAGETILKKWDVNGELSMTAGHIKNNFRLTIARTAPHQEEYRICVDGNKDWDAEGVAGHMSIKIGQPIGDKCSSNEASIDIDMKGELSDNQFEINKYEHRVYAECFKTHLYEPNLNDVHITNYNVHGCTEKYQSLRKYDFAIQYTQIPENIKNALIVALDVFQVVFVPHTWHQHHVHTYLPASNSLNVHVEYPVLGHDLQVEVAGAQESYNLTGISTQDLEYAGIYPYNYHYSYKYQLFNRFGLTKTCLANKHTIFSSTYRISPLGGGCEKCKWVQLASDTANTTFSVLVGKGSGEKPLNLRVEFEGQILEVLGKSGDYNIFLNGKSLTLGKKHYHYDTWFSYGILFDKMRTVSLAFYKYGLYIDFNGESIKMDAPVYGSDLIGKCFS